jgi:uncharacterized damage-inducible protein DinB
MKDAFGSILVLGLICAASIIPTPAAAQSATLAGDVMKDWQAQKDTLLKIADAMPEDKFGFKSTPAQRSYGEQVMHIVQVNEMLIKTLGAKAAAPTINMKATSKAEILQALGATYDHGAAALKEFNDAALLQPVMGPRFLGEATRARIAYFVLSHAMDIYGQMAVYLRLNGIVPPASRNSM